GREVRSSADENMGRIVDVLVDRSGLVRAAIIDFGGFLGVGSRKIAVDWSALHLPEPAKPETPIKLELNRDQANTAPAYEEGKPVTVLSALGKLEPLPFEQSINIWGDVFCRRSHHAPFATERIRTRRATA